LESTSWLPEALMRTAAASLALDAGLVARNGDDRNAS